MQDKNENGQHLFPQMLIKVKNRKAPLELTSI